MFVKSNIRFTFFAHWILTLHKFYLTLRFDGQNVNFEHVLHARSIEAAKELLRRREYTFKLQFNIENVNTEKIGYIN